MKEPLFLQPVFQERIWGGTALRDKFGYGIPSDKTGECWAISGHPNGQSIVKNGTFSGKTLGQLWESNRELFGNLDGDVFPLLTKILDANADLSVQVHPDDEYAKENENGELGKTECWYIIDCKEGAELVFGHTAKTKEELVRHMEEGNWDRLLRRIPIQKGDFFYVPSGSIHALCEGTLVLETQQSSDTTYRVYDYDRTDAEGKKRELHLEKAVDVITVPHQDPQLDISTKKRDGAEMTTFIRSDYFSVYKWEISGNANFQQQHPFLIMSALTGTGTFEVEGKSYEVKRGDHLIVPATIDQFSITGNVELIVSHP